MWISNVGTRAIKQGVRISLGRLGALGKIASQLWYSPAGRGSGAFCTLDC